MEIPLTDIGVIAALVFLVIAFLRHLKNKDERFVDVISNHMNDSTKAQTELTDAIKGLTDSLK